MDETRSIRAYLEAVTNPVSSLWVKCVSYYACVESHEMRQITNVQNTDSQKKKRVRESIRVYVQTEAASISDLTPS